MRKDSTEKKRPEEDTSAEPAGKPSLDAARLARLKRVRPHTDVEEDEGRQRTDPEPVSAGPVEHVIELAFNPTRDAIRGVTVIDRMQGRLFPIIDTANRLLNNCLEIATFRQSRTDYRLWYGKPKPEPVDAVDELMFRTAQWQKSIAGKNLERATDIALAEMETRSPEDEDYGSSGRGFED